jgi:serine/threonine protein kinase
MIEPGTQFGAYRLLEKLGEGGMGVVYSALDTELQRTVAIKTLIGSPGSDSTARFLREAKAASRLQHPSIVTIYHIGVQGDTRYIVMELVEGSTLKKVIGGRAMNLRQACDVALLVCEGLAAAHDTGVVHRDIKAENIIITPRGGVKLLGFGLSKRAGGPSADAATIVRTEAGVVMGTVSHMSPEQAMGQEVDARSDVFSFGAMFYEMLSGRMPFAAQTAQAILARVLNHDPDPISLSNPAVTPELEQIAHDCLQKDRALRPTAHELLTMLRSARDGLSGRNSAVPSVAAISNPSAQAAGSGATRVMSAAPASLRVMTPSSGIASKSGRLVAPSDSEASAAPTGATAGMHATYWALRIARIALSIVTATVPLSFLLLFIIGGGVIRPEVVEGTFVMNYMTAIVGPVLELADRVFSFRTLAGRWNLLLPVMAIATVALRRVVHLPVEKAEHWAKQRVARATRIETRGPVIATGTKVTDQRMAMLREYAETKKLLFQQKRRLAFLSVDVTNAARVKSGEDKLVLEHAFAEYRKYVERVLSSNNVWKTSWQAETTLCAFHTVDAAVRAGQQIIAELGWFNDGVHQARNKFEVHGGVSLGDVVFPDDKRIEDVTDEALDLAIALREAAPAGALWLTREVQAEVADGTGFSGGNQYVLGQEVREWRPSTSRPAAAAAPELPPVVVSAEVTRAFPTATLDAGEATMPPTRRA